MMQAAESAAGVKFTPVRMTVNCWDKLWNMAERHAREKGNVAVSMSSFARWKMRACNLKGWQWRHRAGEVRTPECPFQLFILRVPCCHLLLHGLVFKSVTRMTFGSNITSSLTSGSVAILRSHLLCARFSMCVYPGSAVGTSPCLSALRVHSPGGER